MSNIEGVTFNIEGLNIHIKDSYLVATNIGVYNYVTMLTQLPEFQAMRDAGYTRTTTSMCNEWIAHNVLYKLGIARNRTRDVDLEQSESIFRRICYWVLAKFNFF